MLSLVTLLIYMLLGFVVGRFFHLKPDGISKLLIFILLPVVTFWGVFRCESPGLYLTLGVGLFLTLAALGSLVFRFARRLLPSSERGILAYMAGTANTGYFGIPVSLALFGESAFSLAVVFVLVCSLYEQTFGFYFVVRSNHSLRESIRRVLRLPSLWSFLAAMGLRIFSFELPDGVLGIFSDLRTTYSVLGMMLVGLGMSQIPPMKGEWRFVGVSLGLKFVVIPALVLSLATLFKIEPFPHWILFSLLPIAANSVPFATLGGAPVGKVGLSVFLSHLMSMGLILTLL